MDHAVLLWMAAHRTGWATASARALMVLGTRPLLLAAAGLAILILLTALRSWRLGGTALLAGGGALVLSIAAKAVIHRPRPPAALRLVSAHGFSMPSTDGALTAAAATVLIAAALRTGRRAGRLLATALAAAVVVVGVALVYLGAHWTTDVLAGWLLGAATGGALALLLRAGPPPDGRKWRAGSGNP